MQNNVVTSKSATLNLWQKIQVFVKRSPARMALILAAALYILTIAAKPAALNITAITSITMLTLLLSFASAGQTLVLIGGGMDFTVGATMSASAILTTAFMNGQDGNFMVTFGAVMLMSLMIGLLNGVCSVKMGLPPMIVTMAISNVVSRLQYVLTQGSPLGYASPTFIKTVTSKIWGVIPSLSLYALILFPLMFYILNRSRLGRQVYLVGNNPVAARLNGVSVNKVVILTYVISALFSGFTGMLGAAYMQSAKCQMFDNYAYESLIAVIVGGTTLTGGVGSYTGSIAGSLLMVVLNNTLTAFNLAQPARNVLLGLVLVLLLILYNRGKSVRQ
ncbi:MAG: ABC transporter permease [Clostridiales bacterium]|nr:ABC transporter permease [Clostridiales bacterium]